MDRRVRRSLLLMLLLAALIMPASAGDGPYFYIILSPNEDAYDNALFIGSYLGTFGIRSEIVPSMNDISRDDALLQGHPLSLRFWHLDDKIILRSEDLRTGELYFIASEYGRTITPAENRAWLTEELNGLCWDLYLDDLIEKDARMKAENGEGVEEYPVIWVEEGYGDSKDWSPAVLEALLGEGLDARLTDDSMKEVTEEDERPFSLRFWVFPTFTEISLFDISEDASDMSSYYIDMERNAEDIDAFIEDSARQIRRLMENDRSLILIRP